MAKSSGSANIALKLLWMTQNDAYFHFSIPDSYMQKDAFELRKEMASL
jgi:hypothetical protein